MAAQSFISALNYQNTSLFSLRSLILGRFCKNFKKQGAPGASDRAVSHWQCDPHSAVPVPWQWYYELSDLHLTIGSFGHARNMYVFDSSPGDRAQVVDWKVYSQFFTRKHHPVFGLPVLRARSACLSEQVDGGAYLFCMVWVPSSLLSGVISIFST